MRILMVNAHGNDITAGGVEKGIAILSDELTRRNHTVAFLNAFPGGRVSPGMDVTVLHPDDWRSHPIRRIRNHVGDVVAHPSGSVAEVVARTRPDVVHTHNLPGISPVCGGVSRRQGVPVLHTIHDYHLLCPRTTLMRRNGTTPCRPHPALCGLRTAARPVGRRGFPAGRSLRAPARLARPPLPRRPQARSPQPDGPAGRTIFCAGARAATGIDRVHRQSRRRQGRRPPACSGSRTPGAGLRAAHRGRGSTDPGGHRRGGAVAVDPLPRGRLRGEKGRVLRFLRRGHHSLGLGGARRADPHADRVALHGPTGPRLRPWRARRGGRPLSGSGSPGADRGGDHQCDRRAGRAGTVEGASVLSSRSTPRASSSVGCTTTRRSTGRCCRRRHRALSGRHGATAPTGGGRQR